MNILSASRPIRKIVYGVLSFVGILLCSVALYFLLAFVLSRIPVNSQVVAGKDVTIYILTNGVHTDIVVPLRTSIIDWSQKVRFTDTKSHDSSATFVAFGWGDKGFYLETPTWADLSPKVAFRAATGLSTSAIHATFYTILLENKNCKRITISTEQYKKLVHFISKSFQQTPSGLFICINTNAQYGEHDAFYEAVGSYSIFHTCNTWANRALQSCEQKSAFWTPFDTGIFYHYSE